MDRLPDGTATKFGTLARNLQAEQAAMEYGLAPGQVRRGLRHAAIAPMHLGIQIVIAKSYARIHRSNLINFGILPLKFSNPEDYERIDRGDRLLLEDTKKSFQGNQSFTILNQTKNYSFEALSDFNDREKEILLTGGLLPHAKKSPLSI